MAAKRRGSQSLLELVLSAIVIIFAVGLFWQHDRIVDQMSVWGYQPPAEIIALADDTTMTDKGRWYFYASKPQLEERETFNQHCTNQSEESIILGCYAGKRIFIYNVNDERLPYVEEVTAAHEMLHAVYERMSGSERERVDALIDRAIKNNKDEHIASMTELYRVREPDRLHNEMHSIFGTEASSIPEELEKHYAQYFADRGRVVEMADQYKNVFNDLRDQQQRLNRQLQKLSSQIESRGAVYDGAVDTFEGKVRAFNQKARSGGFATQEEYDSERAALAAEQQQLESERSAINALVAEHNRIREQLQELIIETERLNESIDSRAPAEAPNL